MANETKLLNLVNVIGAALFHADSSYGGMAIAPNDPRCRGVIHG